MNITKKNLSRKIAEGININIKDGDLFIDSFINIIKNKLAKNKKVKISNFGTFIKSDTPERLGRNPKTKESFIIKKKKRISLMMSSKMKDYLNWKLIIILV